MNLIASILHNVHMHFLAHSYCLMTDSNMVFNVYQNLIIGNWLNFEKDIYYLKFLLKYNGFSRNELPFENVVLFCVPVATYNKWNI